MEGSFHDQKDEKLEGDLDDAGKGNAEGGSGEHGRRMVRDDERNFDGEVYTQS